MPINLHTVCDILMRTFRCATYSFENVHVVITLMLSMVCTTEYRRYCIKLILGFLLVFSPSILGFLNFPSGHTSCSGAAFLLRTPIVVYRLFTSVAICPYAWPNKSNLAFFDRSWSKTFQRVQLLCSWP